ncbi:MAG: T9SS type A sorting domain-containing protein [Bacteroidia bacterium]|nr:T9SS type A sorting domain-containing protein [Bacteroidia bacterium]
MSYTLRNLIFFWWLTSAHVLYAQSYFNKRVDYGNVPEIGYNVLIKDSGYVVTGLVSDISGRGGIGWLELDAAGTINKRIRLGSERYIFLPGLSGSMVESSDTGYFLYGCAIDTTGNQDAMLFRFSSEGDTMWTRRFGDDFAQKGYLCRQTPDKYLFLLGQSTTDDPSGDLWLIKADSFGNIIWEKTYRSSLNTYEGEGLYGEGAVLELTHDGGVIMGGTTGAGYPYIGLGADMWVVKVDASGNIQWQRKLGNSYNDGLSSILCTADTNYLIVGAVGDSIHPYYSFLRDAELFIARLDNAGNTVWEKKIEGNYGYEGAFFCYSISSSANTFLIAGPSENDSYLMKLNFDGDIIWSKYHDFLKGELSSNLIFNIAKTVDNGIVATGVLLAALPDSIGPPPWRQDLWALKLDSLGCAYPGCELAATGIGEEESLSGLRVYPNPTSGSVTIEVEAPAVGRVLITDLTGKIIRQVDTPPGFSVLEFGYPLAAGTYLCVLITDGTRHSSQLLIVQ